MMKIFTAAQIRNWDAYSIEHEPVSSIQLMERAATASCNWLQDHVLNKKITKPAAKETVIKIFCGKGNNGGDGLAIARILISKSYKVFTYILDTENKSSHDFDYNLIQLQATNNHIHFISDKALFPEINDHDLIIDALFGTGLNKPMEGLAASLLQHINLFKARVVAIDIPSGMYADKTSVNLLTIKANDTLSFQTYKMAFLLAENEAATGAVHILNIGLHKAFENKEPAQYNLTGQAFIKQIYRPRKQFAHKGNFGHALLLAGSYGKMGAAILVSKACLRSGVGLLTSFVPACGYEILQATTPEAMVITATDIDYSKYTIAGAGPGLGTGEEAVKLITHLLQHHSQLKNQSSGEGCSLVLDADALNILAAHPALLKQLPANTILTPHPKEFERLFGKTNNDFEQITVALQKANQYQCYIILKGHHSFIATPSGKGFFNNTGNAGMATGGSGDVLTGILTGLAAQGYTTLETCLLGVYLHGLAGDIAANKFGQEAMLAGDITESLGDAFKSLS